MLHSWKTNKNAYKAFIAAEYNGVKLDLSPDFTMGVTNKSPEYLKMNPIGKVNKYSGDAWQTDCMRDSGCN